MIIEITNNPHSFIAFSTASMGIGYTFFNRQGFGLGKLITLVFLGGTLFLTAYERHHMVDIGLGLFIGFLHAKGKIGVINPFQWITGAFNRFRWQLQARNNARVNARAQAESNQRDNDFREQEAKKRQEQARKDREYAKHKESNSKQQKSNKKNSRQSQNRSSTNNSYEQYRKNYQKAKPRPKTKRELALEVLGLEPNSTLEEAKRARNKLMSLYHPDKLAGLPEGRRKQAEEEAKKINWAWSVVKK